jgi:hypothetical protein
LPEDLPHLNRARFIGVRLVRFVNCNWCRHARYIEYTQSFCQEKN